MVLCGVGQCKDDLESVPISLLKFEGRKLRDMKWFVEGLRKEDGNTCCSVLEESNCQA